MTRPLESWIDAVEDDLDDGRFDHVFRLLDKAQREYPDCAELFALRGDANWAIGMVLDASASYEKAVALEPRSADFLAALARIRFSLCDFFGAHRYAKDSLKHETRAEALDVLSRLAERSGRLGDADRLAARANLMDEEAFPKPFRVDEEDFAAAVEEAIADLPDKFREAVAEKNVAIVIDAVPDEEILIEEDPPFDPSILGLYRGVPLPERSEGSPAEPDTIHIFRHNIERVAESRAELVREIAITVYHELGHFFGLTEEELADLDLE